LISRVAAKSSSSDQSAFCLTRRLPTALSRRDKVFTFIHSPLRHRAAHEYI
jgi:hypothetical protein